MQLISCPHSLIDPRRSNQPSDAPKKEVPNGVTTWDFSDLGARVSCSCSRYHSAAHKLYHISTILAHMVSEMCVLIHYKLYINIQSLLHEPIKTLFERTERNCPYSLKYSK